MNKRPPTPGEKEETRIYWFIVVIVILASTLVAVTGCTPPTEPEAIALQPELRLQIVEQSDGIYPDTVIFYARLFVNDAPILSGHVGWSYTTGGATVTGETEKGGLPISFQFWENPEVIDLTAWHEADSLNLVWP